jgi:hypothetical protein
MLFRFVQLHTDCAWWLFCLLHRRPPLSFAISQSLSPLPPAFFDCLIILESILSSRYTSK